MNAKKLQEEIGVRKKNHEMIRERINAFCFMEYGINDFFALADEYLGTKSRNDKFNVCLARQIPCQNVEHLAVDRLASFLSDNGIDAKAMPMSFARDSFNSNNEYKMSLIKIPHLHRGRKGKLFIKNESVLASHHRDDVEGKILLDFETIDGVRLIDFHHALRKNIFGEKDTFADFSLFFKELARQSIASGSRCAPGHLFVRSGTREKKVHPHAVDFANGQDPRPPAAWYYLLYLMLFVDGTCALASTVDEDPRVISWFTSNVDKIGDVCGFKPLFIDTPLKVQVEDLTFKLNEFPRWIAEDSAWIENIVLSGMADHDLYRVMEQIEKRLIALS